MIREFSKVVNQIKNNTSSFEVIKMQVGLLDDMSWTTWRYELVIALGGLGVRVTVEGKVSTHKVASNAISDQEPVYEPSSTSHIRDLVGGVIANRLCKRPNYEFLIQHDINFPLMDVNSSV